MAGFASRPMRDGPRGEWRCSLRRFGAAGECPPRPYPPEKNCSRVGAGRFGGRWGRRGGRRAKGRSRPRSTRIQKIVTRPQVGCLFSRSRSPGRPIICGRLGLPIWGRGGHRGMLRPVHRWAAGGQGGRCPDREPALASRTRLARLAAARRRPPIPAVGVGPRAGVGGYLRPGSRAR